MWKYDLVGNRKLIYAKVLKIGIENRNSIRLACPLQQRND